MLLIESTDDLYWGAGAFGPRQAAQLFQRDDLPLVIADNGGESLFLQIINDVLPVICYHDEGEVIGAWVVPDDNVTRVRASGARCPRCQGRLLLYQSGRAAVKVCSCGHTEGDLYVSRDSG